MLISEENIVTGENESFKTNKIANRLRRCITVLRPEIIVVSAKKIKCLKTPYAAKRLSEDLHCENGSACYPKTQLRKRNRKQKCAKLFTRCNLTNEINFIYKTQTNPIDHDE